MSLARLALRLAAYEALNPFATMASGPWPTIAGRNVFDSRLDLTEGDERVAADLENAPAIILYTERDDTAPYDPQLAKYPAQERLVHLVAEILIAATGSIQVEGADGDPVTVAAITSPATDRQHEALLDLLEAQVLRLLGKWSRQEMPASAALYNQVMMEVRAIESVPQRSADRAVRYAARTITLHLKIKADDWPLYSDAPAGAGLLPQPLRAVAAALDPASTGYALCQAMIGLVQPPSPRTPLATIHAFLGLGRTPIQSDGSDSDFQASLPFSPTYYVLGF